MRVRVSARVRVDVGARIRISVGMRFSVNVRVNFSERVIGWRRRLWLGQCQGGGWWF